MYECRYCTTVFPTLPSEGGCPRCGAPNPKHLEPEVVRVVETKYVYVPERSYYTPRFTSYPVRAARSSFFGTFGYKLATFLLVLAVALLVAWFFYWLGYRAPALKTTDPSYQLTLPTALPTAVSVPTINPWNSENWLTAGQARNLREKENVVNLAFLENGGAKYSADHSFTLSSEHPWEQAKPLGVTELTLTETSVLMKAGGYEYTLNILQPFVLASQPTKVIVVDAQGAIWQAELSSLTIAALSDVVSGLTITIAPNPNLSFTY